SLHSPRSIASIPILRARPKVEQAATGPTASPLIFPIIVICDAGVLGIFHKTLADTSPHGAGGVFHFSARRVSWRRLSRISFILPVATSPSTEGLSILLNSLRYSWSLSDFCTQKAYQMSSALSRSSASLKV